MNRLLLISCLCFALASCNNNSKNVTVVYDTIDAPDTMNFHIVDNPEKNFTGTLPCADCAGILTELYLNTDSLTYNLTETYQGKEEGDTVFISYGKYVNNEAETERKIINLLSAENPNKIKYFKWMGDTGLLMLDKMRNEIAGNKNYYLTKK